MKDVVVSLDKGSNSESKQLLFLSFKSTLYPWAGVMPPTLKKQTSEHKGVTGDNPLGDFSIVL